MNSDSTPLSLEEFLEILEEQTRVVMQAFKRLRTADRDRFMGRIMGIVTRYIRSAPDAITDIVSQIRNSLTTVEGVVLTMDDQDITHLYTSADAAGGDANQFTWHATKPTDTTLTTPVDATTPWNKVYYMAFGI